jgi:hypothetical protein
MRFVGCRPCRAVPLVRGESVGVGGGRRALVIGWTPARIWCIACSTCSRASPALALVEPGTSSTLGHQVRTRASWANSSAWAGLPVSAQPSQHSRAYWLAKNSRNSMSSRAKGDLLGDVRGVHSREVRKGSIYSIHQSCSPAATGNHPPAGIAPATPPCAASRIGWVAAGRRRPKIRQDRRIWLGASFRSRRG